MSKRNVDVHQLNKCTLCSFRSHVKSTFQRHLMKQHGIKLKGLEANISGKYSTLGRVIGDYGLDQKFSPQEIYKIECNICERKFHDTRQYRFHRKSCTKKNKAIEKSGEQFFCPQCGVGGFPKQKNVNKHLRTCGLQSKDIWCQICPFKCLTIKRIQTHTIDKHNLICKPVEEPDFEQALNRTPYTLERAVVLEDLPKNDSPTDILEIMPIKKKKNMFTCSLCKREFTKERFLNRHIKLTKGNCSS